MQVDVLNVRRSQTRPIERPLHGQGRALALRMRGRHMMRVHAFAVAQQGEIRLGRIGRALQQGESGRFANGDAVARRIRRTTRARRHQFERSKAIQRGEAEAIDPADDHRITLIGRQPTGGTGKHLRAGGTGRRNRQHRPAQTQPRPHKFCRRRHLMRVSIMQRRQKFARDRIAGAKRQFGLQNPGSAGADEHTDARRDPAPLCRLDRRNKIILRQGQIGQAIVSAIEVRQSAGNGVIFQPRHSANPSGQGHIQKITGRQAAAFRQQGRARGRTTRA